MYLYFLQAGYQTKDNTHQYIIQTASTSDLTTSTNVGIPGRWAFSVNGTICSEFTVILWSYFFLFQLSMDGFLSFEPLFFDGFVLNVNKDIIAPLWTDIDTHTRGDISYTLATNGTLLKQASDEINRMFPGTRFTASWVFVATWEKMEFEPDTGVGVTFQVALVSDIDITSPSGCSPSLAFLTTSSCTVRCTCARV
ncbi:alpha-tectorin-like [Astyanax mexicanus]|uniref:Alpha-tectorin-like n=1 Tax=Astyanax mexicanus TaxID=7994 RepID=A0A8T2LCC5_ASTMX|nr:alpha-tectorin-like [Astyanax mexicanus]